MLLSILVSTGCATNPIPESYEPAERIATINVHSLPPGCMVELNDEFMGVTPLQIKVPATDDGEWKGAYKNYVLRASIPLSNGYEQKIWQSGDKVPSRVVFRIPGAMTWYSATQQKPPEPRKGIRIIGP